jgi:predicted nuclease of predicted toxin-antitoxin system
LKFLADENIAHLVIERLRHDGHSVISISEVASGSEDVDVLEMARHEQAILLTDDKDFGELVFRQRRATAGVLLLRLEGMPQSDRASLIAGVVAKYGDQLKDVFTVVAPKDVRIRIVGP